MNRKFFVVTVVVLWGGLCLAPGVSAQPRAGLDGRFREKGFQGGPLGNNEEFAKRREQHFEEMAKELNLTDEQREKIEAHRQQNAEEVKALMEQISQKRRAIGAELQQPQLDWDKVKQLHGQLKELILKREDLMFSGILKIREILTTEQFMMFHEKMGQMRKMWKEKGEKRMPPPPLEDPD
ncbi:MAG TPA: periplasmic heavy metal sensor [Candidatus Omnitrophota bacterium]|nr:periplasmic heavy metal sensor [Candidatus Omnitrophota bacterium]HPN56468.1 periplasmic heavy metal sensor [Candidatus Omnitrophota bacterium]